MTLLVRYTFLNAPWALLTSLSSGLSNYLIILVLSGSVGLAAAGQFRLFLSIIGLLSIFSLMDTGKIAIKYLVQGESGVIKPLLLNRMRWALLGVLTGLITAAVFRSRGQDLWIAIAAASVLLPLTYPADMFAQINQARRQFRINAVYNVTKYTALVVLALIAVGANVAVVSYLVAYSIVVTAFNVYFLSRHPETFEPSHPDSRSYVREGLQLSGSGVFPQVLEHADKFLISYFFGLEALGLYAIGVSTGRLLVRFVKPVLTIYFPILVNSRPPRSVLLYCFVVLSFIGVMGALPLHYYFHEILGATYVEAYPLAVIVLAGLGIHAVAVVIQYSSIYHKNSTVAVPTVTNVTTSILIATYLTASVLHGNDLALLLCAASYPLRDALNAIVTSLLSRRIGTYEQAGSVS